MRCLPGCAEGDGIALLTGFGGYCAGSRSAGALEVNLYLLHDKVLVKGLEAKPELNGATGVIVTAGQPGGIGPAEADGRYGVRIEQPDEFSGQAVKIKGQNLLLSVP